MTRETFQIRIDASVRQYVYQARGKSYKKAYNQIIQLVKVGNITEAWLGHEKKSHVLTKLSYNIILFWSFKYYVSCEVFIVMIDL